MSKDIKEFEGLRVKIDDVIYMPSLDAPADRPHPFVYFISIFNDSPVPVMTWLARLTIRVRCEWH
jgi:hypothetical protein